LAFVAIVDNLHGNNPLMEPFNADIFLATLLLYVSEVDGSLNADELDYINKEVAEFSLDEARKIRRHHSDYELIELLSKAKERYYPGEDGTAVLMGELNGYFKSDGSFSNWEKGIARQLKRLLDQA
jgi:hypothetical protein